MGIIELDDTTHQSLRLVAAALSTTEGGAVAELLRRLAATSPVADVGNDEVPIHAMYRRQRVDAVYDRSAGVITIASGALAGQEFGSPSPAARAVVSAINPAVNPHRNGWGFWIVSATGQTLQSIRHI